ncbi:MAG: M23 family metallopeptidase [Desulfobulbus sp.]|nr:M23 family metallopeptidase [Desulfobulbus sp.]
MMFSNRVRIPAGLFALLLLLLTTASHAATPVFQLPLQCRLSQDCYIQNFIDHDPSPGWQDYTCGSLSYNGHRGTDFALPTLKMMEQGVNVLAAAPGTVMAIRDGEPDISVRTRGQAALAGKDAGNSVRIRHADGWETQYAHMKKGSIAVRVGQKIGAGTILGQVGLSGNTEFPHVHFSVRFRGRDIDPFAPNPQKCGSGQPSLWAAELKASLRYQPTGLLTAGFSTELPQREKVDTGDYSVANLPADSPSLVFWTVIYGIRKNDTIELRLYDPEKRLLYQEQRQAPKHQAMLFAFAGKRLTAASWPSGQYTGHIILTRKGTRMIEATRAIIVQ